MGVRIKADSDKIRYRDKFVLVPQLQVLAEWRIIMAYHTKTDLRNQVIYSVYVRNHSEEGTFSAVEKDLDRIKGLGVDVNNQ